MTSLSLIALQERKRELTLKRRYALGAYKTAEIAKLEALSTISRCMNDLLVLEFQIQRLNTEQTMTASDKAWAEKYGEHKWF